MRSGNRRPAEATRGTERPPLVTVAPAVAAARILEARFGTLAGEGAGAQPPWRGGGNGFQLAPFQADGVARLEWMLDRWGGAFLADDVGMGKTFTALGVAGAALRRGGRVVLVVPPAVRPHWHARLGEMLRSLPADAASHVRLVTHGQLSRGGGGGGAGRAPEARPADGDPAVRAGAAELVIVDEAHAFRNPRTRRYRALARVCHSARVLLLTATPVNNSLWDLYFLIRLWCGDGRFAPLGAPDLRALFEDMARSVGARAAAPPPLRRVLSAVLLRRRRAVAGAGFPGRGTPVNVTYALRAVYGGALGPGLASIGELRLPWFSVAETGDGETTTGAAPLLRLTLLKRLESSAPAFRLSLERLARYNALALEALAAGTLLLPRAARGGGAPADADQLLIPGLVGTPVPAWIGARKLLEDGRADARLLADLLALVDSNGRGAGDPKLAALMRVLNGMGVMPAIVFTGFRDTASYLAERLAGRHRTALLHGSGGAIGRCSAPRAAVVARFAPHANGCAPPAAAERIDVLVATDALSEGINLQDARSVISYDLPWNPVRLVQRIGRIDRLGSPHDRIEIFNFIPDAELESLLRLGERLGAKLDAIRMVTGHGAAAAVGLPVAGGVIADPVGLPRSRWDRLERLARAVCGTANRAGGPAAVPAGGPAAVRAGGRGSAPPAAEAPVHAWLGARGEDPGLLAVFGHGVSQVALAAGPDGGVRRVSDAELEVLLRRALAAPVPPQPREVRLEWVERAERVACRIAKRRKQTRRRPAVPGRLARRVAREVRRLLAAEPGGATRETAGLADALLARLRAGLSVGEELELVSLLDRVEAGQGARGFLQSAAAALAPVGEDRERHRALLLVAVLEFVAPGSGVCGVSRDDGLTHPARDGKLDACARSAAAAGAEIFPGSSVGRATDC